jgi:multiple sugar transport system substrate-binding protein
VKRGLAAAAALTMLLAGCGDSGDGKITLKFVWWGNQDRATLTEQAVKLFEDRNPNIDVQTSFQNFQTYWEKLATETAGGNPPDVMQMDYRYLNEYAGRGVLMDLGTQVDTKDWNPGFVASGKVKDKQVALPLAQNTTTIVYDPKVFADAGVPVPQLGWTWQDYKARATKIHAATGGRVAGATDFGGTEDVFEIWLRQRDKALYTTGGKFGFSEQDLRDFWQLSADFRSANAATPPELTTKLNAAAEETPLGTRKSASEHSYDSLFSGYDGVRKGELQLAPYPSDTKNQLGSYRKPSQLIAASNRGKNKDAAVKLIDFLLNDTEAGKILGANRGLPANLKIREAVARNLAGPNKLIFEYEAAVDKALGDAPQAPPKGDGAVYKLMQRLHEEIVFGRKSIDEAIKQFFTEGNQALS